MRQRLDPRGDSDLFEYDSSNMDESFGEGWGLTLKEENLDEIPGYEDFMASCQEDEFQGSSQRRPG